jgi:hypothetical protein
MARINLTLPDELKARMDKHDINWSQTAAEAFEEKMNAIESKFVGNTMGDAIARLKASKLEMNNESKKEGYETGIKWAMQSAKYVNLKRLAEIESYSEFETIHELADYIEVDNWEFTEWFGEFVGKVDDSFFIEGFIDAAVEVFEKVDD